jgi:hypothetical protein
MEPLTPAGTPAAIVDQVAQATRTTRADRVYHQTLIEGGSEPAVDARPEQFRRWTPVVKALALKINRAPQRERIRTRAMTAMGQNDSLQAGSIDGQAHPKAASRGTEVEHHVSCQPPLLRSLIRERPEALCHVRTKVITRWGTKSGRGILVTLGEFDRGRAGLCVARPSISQLRTPNSRR